MISAPFPPGRTTGGGILNFWVHADDGLLITPVTVDLGEDIPAPKLASDLENVARLLRGEDWLDDDWSEEP